MDCALYVRLTMNESDSLIYPHLQGIWKGRHKISVKDDESLRKHSNILVSANDRREETGERERERQRVPPMDSFYEVQKMNDSGRGNNNKKQTLGENITTLPCPQTEVISLREDNEEDLTGK